MESIKPLPDAVRSSLRSGFIICDLTRVVEELVYNSLDAGATRIAVSIGIGTGYVKVDDDGSGIGREGLVLLGERYATSKFHNMAGPADGNGSFGFLGETLCSISDISLLEILTKTQGRPNGYRKVMKGRKCLFLGIDNDRQDVGTTVIVRDLFYNQPVRRRLMLSSPRKALHSVRKCVFRVALMRSNVSFKVFDIVSEDELLRTKASSCPLSVLRNVSGVEASCLEEISLSEGAFKLAGYVSRSCDFSTTKAVQYIYINSRVVGKGPIHKILNHLANTFWDQLNGDNIGKRSRLQACPVYILNLICPRSFYDLIFEPSGTSVEFKDLAPVLAFLKKSMASIWCLKSSNGESPTSSAGEIAKDEMGKQTESVSADKGWSDACGISRKRCRTLSQVSPGLPYFCPEMQAKVSCSPSLKHPFDKDSRQSLITATRIEEPHAPEEFKDQMEFLGSTGSSEYDYIWKSSNKLCTESEEFLDDISDKRYFSYGEDQKSNSRFINASLVVDANPSHSETEGTTKNHLHFEYSSKEKRAENENMTPFLRNCSSKTQAERTFLSSGKNSNFQMIKRYNCYSDGSDTDNAVEQTALDHKFYMFARNLRKNDSETSNWFPGSHVASDWHEDLGDISINSRCSFPLSEGCSSKEDTNFLVAQVGEFGSSCFSSISDQNSLMLDPFLRFESWDFVCSDGEVSLNSMRNAWSEQFEDDREEAYFDNLAHEFESKDIVHGSSLKCMSTLDCDTFQFGKRFRQNLDGPSTKLCDLFTGRTNSLSSNPCCEDYMDPISASWQTFNMKETNANTRRFHQKNFDSGSRPQRSHSAPPIYKGKRQFLLTNHCLTVKPRNPDMKTVHDAQIFREGTLVKNAKSASTKNHQNPEKSYSEDPHNCARPKVKETLDIMLLNNEAQNNQFHESHMHGRGSFVIEDPGSASLSVKWRNGAPTTGGGRTSRKFSDECSVLDISSGILHLACDSLIPKSVSRRCLEDAKVLLQVDKKFIPVVAGGTLVVVDQHAADERIRLEELRQKVLSGEVKSITYLEVEKELVLPETAYQLLYNYAEPIQGWGWICSIHAQSSGSFKKNLNLLTGQPPSVTLLSVPCILNVNLTDTDLLEYLEQLAATDGSSTMPPAVIRILNYKACRGAIMFGDTLLPSECSLIIEELKQTSLCFQCAHGRPTTAPLVNLEVLHNQLATLRLKNGNMQSWHGLSRQDIDLKRAKQRLDTATRGG
ncbi:hypothetical protein Dimus_017434 [Dionaea muscipula]